MGIGVDWHDGQHGQEVEWQMMVAAKGRVLEIQPGTHRRKNCLPRLRVYGFELACCKLVPSSCLMWLLSLLVFVVPQSSAVAQDSKQGLARPEWQLRADLEFRLACQASLQRLCLELIETHSKSPSDPANAKLLEVAKELLETTDGKLPPTLPEHPASAEYIQSRKTAVVEWNKAYKAKGRELPTVALESERRFQESHRDKTEPPVNSTPDESEDASVNKQLKPSSKESKDNRTAGKEAKSAEKKLEELTIKGLVSLIMAVDKYRSAKPAGDTTLEREQSKRVAKDLMTKYVDNQPDYYFTYPIKDVSGGGRSLRFEVADPVEFKQLRNELNADLLLTHQTNSIEVENADILKLSSMIKPGDYLRVRFKVRFVGFGRFQNSSNVMFDVKHLAVVGDPSVGDGNSLFTEKAIVGVQLVKKSATTERSR